MTGKEPIWAAIQREWREGLEDLDNALGPYVLSIRWQEREDFSGHPAIFFQVVLSNEQTLEPNLCRVVFTVESIIKDHLDPRNYQSLRFYFNFRSESENQALKDKGW